MFKRKRQESHEPADGTLRCRLCGTDVEVDSQGRCRLGHRVVAPPMAELSSSDTAGTAAADSVDEPLPVDTSTPGGPVGSPASPFGELSDDASASTDASRSLIASDHGSTGVDEADAFARAGDVVDEATADTDDDREAADADDDRELAATGASGVSASRARLLEAASWFGVDDLSTGSQDS